MSNQEQKNPAFALDWRFWTSHVLIMLSTVLGVYLAAHAGFQTAIEFEAVKSDKDSFYLRRSLVEEISDNVKTAEAIAIALDQGKVYRREAEAGMIVFPKLRLFIWQAMTASPSSLAVPSSVISAVHNYYDSVNEALDRVDKHMISGRVGATQLRTANMEVQKSAIGVLNEEIDGLRKRLLEIKVRLYE